MKTKKLLFMSIGAATSIILPITTILSCGNNNIPKVNYKFVKKPDYSSVHPNFYGKPGNGTYRMPTYKDTSILIKKGGSKTTPSKKLKTGDEVILEFTPNNGYVWKDNHNNKKFDVQYTVDTLPRAPINTTLTNKNWASYTTHDDTNNTLTVWEGVSIISPGTFKSKNDDPTWITNLILPGSLTNIESSTNTEPSAFRNFKIQNLKFPFPWEVGQSTLKIGNEAFYNSNLKGLMVPNNVTYIGDQAFYNSPLKFLVWNQYDAEFVRIQNIGNKAFYNATLVFLHLPHSIQTIGNRAFYNSPIIKLLWGIWGSSIKSIGDEAFFNSKLIDLVISSNISSIGKSAFANSPITDLEFNGDPNKLEHIGNKAFGNTLISSIKSGAKWITWAKLHPNAFKESQD